MAGRGHGGDPPLDEQAFHRWLAERLKGRGRGLLPLGDDTAAIPISRGRVALLTTDALSEGTHFLTGSPPESVGSAAAAVSLSDIAAKGGVPIAFLLDLILPPGTSQRWAEAVVDGAERTLARFGAHVVGGDTKPGRGRAVVGSLLGVARADRLAPRSGARRGDLLVVTGAVGRGGCDGLALGAGRKPNRRELVRLLAIRPRVMEGIALAASSHAMMDTSDGLADSARWMADASRAEIVVRWEDLPLDPRLTRAPGPRSKKQRIAFFGGDYELLAALPPGRLRSARRALSRIGCPLSVVGWVGRGHGAWLEVDGARRPMPPGGWRPFAVRRRR